MRRVWPVVTGVVDVAATSSGPCCVASDSETVVVAPVAVLVEVARVLDDGPSSRRGN